MDVDGSSAVGVRRLLGNAGCILVSAFAAVPTLLVSFFLITVLFRIIRLVYFSAYQFAVFVDLFIVAESVFIVKGGYAVSVTVAPS